MLLLTLGLASAADLVPVPRGGATYAEGSWEDGSEWLALVCGDDGCSLEPATLRTSRVVLHTPQGVVPGQRLRTEEDLDAVVLLSGLGLQPGPVDTTYHAGLGAPARPEGGGELAVAVEGRWPFQIVPRVDADRVRFTLVHEGEQTFLEEIPTVGYSELHWSGDLDGDGHLDLLVGIGSHMTRSTTRQLFMSSGDAVRLEVLFDYLPPDIRGC